MPKAERDTCRSVKKQCWDPGIGTSVHWFRTFWPILHDTSETTATVGLYMLEVL
jgi:hypothetical protein